MKYNICLSWNGYFLWLACTCEETCESVWPPNASLYASSTCPHLRLFADPFDQCFKTSVLKTTQLRFYFDLHHSQWLYNNYSMSPSWIWSDKITNERVARVGYNHLKSNKSEWNNCFSKFSNRVLPQFLFPELKNLQSVRKKFFQTWRTIFHMT